MTFPPDKEKTTLRCYPELKELADELADRLAVDRDKYMVCLLRWAMSWPDALQRAVSVNNDKSRDALLFDYVLDDLRRRREAVEPSLDNLGADAPAVRLYEHLKQTEVLLAEMRNAPQRAPKAETKGSKTRKG